MNERLAAEPCPNCASRDVRWRKARPTDVPLRWAAYFIDFVVGGAGRDHASSMPRGSGSYGFDTPTSTSYGELRERFEMKVGLKVPKAFWRCPACRKSGAVRDLDSLGADIALLSSMEGSISEEGGGVSQSIGGDTKQ